MAFAIYLVAGFAGAICGGLLILGLIACRAGPEVLAGLLEHNVEPSAEVAALYSADSWILCANLFIVPIAIGLFWFHSGSTPREYLGLKWPGLKQGLSWGLLLLAVDYGYRFLIVGLGIPLTNAKRYHELGRFSLFLPLMFVSIAVLTPILEELIFRGYLLEGLRSRIGEIGAIAVTSAIWAALHNDLPARTVGLFLVGVLFALARLRIGSIYIPTLVHALTNAVAVFSIANQ